MRLIVLACVVAYIAAQTPGSATCPDNACVQTCTNGFLKDDKGCATCRCACKAVTCSNTCESFAKDQDGCDTCDCAKKTCPTLTSTERCDYGREVDSDGCETDRCKPPPSICPQVMCLIACEFGMTADAKTGCPTCQCVKPVCPICNTFAPCRYGYKYDDKGCQTCDCNDPPPTCSATVTCRLYCEFGYEKDANGCDTCTCAKPVCPAIACATFARCANGFAKDEKTGCDTCQCAPDPTCTRPICTAQWCEFGYKRDPTTKCDTCECAPNPNPCPQIRCANQCKYGNIVDENGCQTCQCVAGPTDCTTVGINSNPTSAAREPCAIRCAYGLQVDSTTKCPICACNPAPPCPLIKCATQCPNGYVYENGCQTCQCITRVDVCTFAASAGSCKAAIDAWAFDTKTRKCSKFTWGGCPDGNSNRFETLAQCEKTCLPPFTVTIKIDAAVTLTSDQADAVTRAIASATGAERVALDSSKAGEVTIFVYDGSLTTKQVEQAVKDDIAKNDSSIKTAAGGQAVTGSTVVGEQVSASPANVAAPVAGVVVALLVALRLL